MYITKQSCSILKYIYQKQTVTYASLSKKFKRYVNLDEIIIELLQYNYLEQIGGSTNKYGEPIPIVALTKFKLQNIGIAEVESHQWFNAQYALTSLLIPIIVGVASSLITALILLLF